MSLQKLKLKGLRGFATSQELSFAVPDGRSGSGLTILVGPNNGGKSTVVESLRALAAPSSQDAQRPQSFTEGRRNKNAEDKILIQVTDLNDDVVGGLRTVASGGSETEWFPSEMNEQIFVLPSRRYFNPYFSKNTVTRERYMMYFGFPSTRGAPLEFESRLFQVQQNRVAFDAELKKVMKVVPKWAIDQSDTGQYYLKVETGGLHHSSEGMGEGLVSLFITIDALYDSSPGDMIVIDEPELSLHPSLQRKLALLLGDYASDRQVVIATHSPYFVDFEALLCGAKIARLHLKDGSSVVSALSESTAQNLAGFLNDRNNPHVLGLDAREAFFLDDGVILVEGQEDVVLYRKIAGTLGIEIDGDFFGWGVGGAEKMRTIAALLSDLGFEKIVGLLDGNRAALLPGLKKEFPRYHFHTIPADDIRTKSATKPRPAISGVLDELGNIRPEYKDVMKELLTSVNQAL